jgi:hypothetical protein
MPTSSSTYQNLRDNINPNFAQLSDEQLQTVMERSGADAEMMEGFFDDLGKFASSAGQAVLKAAPAILPVAGSIVGTAFGGPLGASLGGSLGSMAGKAIGSATGQAPAPGGGGGGIGGLVSSGLGAVMGGSPAAGQLLQTITKPETMQALASMAMGAMGKPNIPVGGTSVPVGAFGNLLKMLSGQVESEYAEAMARSEGDGTPSYMRDFAGQAVSDPAVPQNRAVALYELLQSAERDDEQDAAEMDAETDSAEQEMEALQAEYDEMELAEVYDSEEA